MDISNSNVGAAVVPQSKGPLERFIGVFVSPEPTMQDIAARPTWVLPLIILLLSGALSGYFLKDAIIQMQLEGMEKRNMTAEQIEQARPMMENMIKYTAPLAPLLTTPLIYALIAAVLLFVGNVILGGEARFATLFSVTCWAGMISLLGSIINVPIMMNRQVMESATSLGSLFPSEEKQSFFHNLLGQIDLFTLWWVVVLGFGLAAAAKFSTRKAMPAVFIAWAIFAVAGAAIKTMFS
ncbi:MAG: hypothetical protein ALAOOOJD_00331 [bacterium]|nr:hypothetical protein [bacterium]